jgi:hypothetical protein
MRRIRSFFAVGMNLTAVSADAGPARLMASRGQPPQRS